MTPFPELSVQLYSRGGPGGRRRPDPGRAGRAGFLAGRAVRAAPDSRVAQTWLGPLHHTAPTAHGGFLDADRDEVFAAAADLGVQTLIEPYVDPARWEDPADVAAIADGLNQAAVAAAGYGLRVGYHNHHFELQSMFDGRHALEVLADQLDPDVMLEVDTYWAYAGGADVPALLARLGDRVVALHVKDGDGTLNTKAQTAVGSGRLPILDILAAAPTALRVVELDDTDGDRMQAIADSRSFLLAASST